MVRARKSMLCNGRKIVAYVKSGETWYAATHVLRYSTWNALD
jgi:hypothetical protein